jgi:fumarylacetoacetase
VRSGNDVVDAAGISTLLESDSLAPLLAAGYSGWEEVIGDVRRALGDLPRFPIADVTMHLPCPIGDFVDFYSSLHHAQNVGRIFRPDSEPLTPNWRHLPIGYHGRSGTIVLDGTPIPRPHGQRGPGEFGPSQRLDFELEVGFITGPGPSRIPVGEAESYIFGLVLVNDWSARDIQAWEYQPLGPFLGKSFATTISPWVVPLLELADRRVEAPAQDPPPLPYLTPPGRSIDLDLEVRLNDRVITQSNLRNVYWTMSQQLAHATSNGATIRAGDLFASGTISGPTDDSLGCLLEITKGQGPFLEDGDTVSFTAGDPAFGICSGVIQPG